MFSRVLAARTVSWLASDLPFLGRLLAIVMSSAAGLWKLFRDQAERGSGIGLKLFGFIAESVFTIIPESCSGSPRNSVRNHPGITFTLDRMFDFALSGAFHPLMIGIANQHIYIVDPAGKVVYYPLNLEPAAGRVINSGPELLSGTESLRQAARLAGHIGRIVIDLIVGEDGRPEDIRVQPPIAGVPEVIDAVRAWRFRPAVRSGKTVAVRMRVDVN
jgi:hypothetical protein